MGERGSPLGLLINGTFLSLYQQHSKTPSLQLKLLLLAHLIKGSSTQHLTGLGEPTQGQMGGK